MKNKNLLKTLGIMLLSVFLLTWIIPASTQGTSGYTLGAITPTGYTDIFSTLEIILVYFAKPAILILFIGMFYGVINKTGEYKDLVEKIARIFKNKKVLFVILTVLFFGVTTALTGIYLPMFMFVPLFIAVLLELKYKKLPALLATVGSTTLGLTAEISSSIFKSVTSVTENTYLWIKVGLLVLLLALVVLYIIRTSKSAKKDTKEEINDYMFIPEKREIEGKSTRGLAALIAIILMFIVFVVGMKVWSNTTIFDTIHTGVDNVKIGSFAILRKILGTTETLGAWGMNSLYATIGFFIIVVSIFSGLKFGKMVEACGEGAKKVMGLAIMSALISIVVIFTLNSGFLATIINFIAKGGNEALVAVSTLIGSPFMVDETYAAQYLLNVLNTISGNESLLGLYGFITQVTYGFTMLIAPSSILLMIGLYYTGEKYTKWFKYIWKLLLVVLALCMIAIVLATII